MTTGEAASRSQATTLLRAAVAAIAVAGVVVVTVVLPGLNLADANAYWEVPLDDLYGDATVGGPGAYLYAPAFAQVLWPLKALPWPAFAFIWLVGSATILVRLLGPAALLVALIPPVLMELQVGNIHLLLALAIGVGLRWPGAWAIVLLTKPTLGVGLLWWVARREWRPLGIALLTTVVAAGISLAIAPGLWAGWISALAMNATQVSPPDSNGVIHVPLLVRLPIAAVIVAWGARSDRPWTIAVAATLALPVLWVNGLVVLLAIPMLEGWTLAGVRERWHQVRPRQAP